MKTLARDDDKAEILRRLAALTPQSERRWGKMTVHQMVCHLADGFRMTSGERTVASVAALHRRTIVKWIALYAPMRWPPEIQTVPEIDALVSGTAPTDFSVDLADVAVRLEAFLEMARAGRCVPHPIFGPLSTPAWMRWGYLHTDHHLRQFGH
jgi:hypothetical protein